MKILCDAGLVIGRKDGKWMHYRICCDGVKRVRVLMAQLLSVENIPADCECKKG
jgi:ArsR family transcriptional regulator